MGSSVKGVGAVGCGNLTIIRFRIEMNYSVFHAPMRVYEAEYVCDCQRRGNIFTKLY